MNAEFDRTVVMRTAKMDWQASPSASVWRKRLDLIGPKEAGRVTSVVRYDADSIFPSHPHPDGEEIFVLDGVFSDEHGDYPAGTYLLNPEGFSHAPFSRQGCVLFVKLRQYPGLNRRQVTVDTRAADWQPGPADGVSEFSLYAEAGYPEAVRLWRFASGASMPAVDDTGGLELFVLDGALEDDEARYEAGTWVRYPAGSQVALHSAEGGTAYVKTGHLAG